MRKVQYIDAVIKILLIGLMFLSYPNTILAQSSPYITGNGLVKLKNALTESLAEVAGENGYTLHAEYTYLSIPESNIIIAFSGGIAVGIVIGSISEVAATTAFVSILIANIINYFNIVDIGIINDLNSSFGVGITDGIAIAASNTSILFNIIVKVSALGITAIYFWRDPSDSFFINNPNINPNPNRLEVHYKLTSNTISQYEVINSCFVFLSRRGNYIDVEVDECVWQGIFPQNVPGSLRIGQWHDGVMGQKHVVARFSIHDPIN